MMERIRALRYDRLYMIWGGLFALTALLGLLFPGAAGFGRALLLGCTAGFFLPPWLILTKARAEGSKRQLRLVRYLALASLVMTMVLFCAGILSVRFGEALGNVVHVLMSVICAPLMCGNYYVLPMFLWATLLVGSFRKGK